MAESSAHAREAPETRSMPRRCPMTKPPGSSPWRPLPPWPPPEPAGNDWGASGAGARSPLKGTRTGKAARSGPTVPEHKRERQKILRMLPAESEALEQFASRWG